MSLDHQDTNRWRTFQTSTAVIGFIAFAVGRIKGNRLLTGPFFVNAIVLAALLLLIFAGRL